MPNIDMGETIRFRVYTTPFGIARVFFDEVPWEIMENLEPRNDLNLRTYNIKLPDKFKLIEELKSYSHTYVSHRGHLVELTWLG